jgi:hypothetical protein
MDPQKPETPFQYPLTVESLSTYLNKKEKFI